MRGEHCSSTLSLTPRRGSSPHARGTPGLLSLNEVIPGIIPACAGNTKFTTCAAIFLRDHPRMRGEHVRSSGPPLSFAGSSPHARGTPRCRRHDTKHVGIIPACAGNTAHSSCGFPCAWDHPRMRGEHPATLFHTFLIPGSSPHARGTPSGADADGERIGIIPACAGNTTFRTIGRARARDHPRMRGEHSFKSMQSSVSSGSSPHARGTPYCKATPSYRMGIIPACAGNTIQPVAVHQRAGDHPRMRGEHWHCW